MRLKTRWTVRIEDVKTQLSLGPDRDSATMEPVNVSLVVHGLAPDAPGCAEECLDLEPVFQWITDTWPRSAPTPFLESRVNELLAQIFESDRRVQDAWVGVYRAPSGGLVRRAGVERQASRLQFQSQASGRSKV